MDIHSMRAMGADRVEFSDLRWYVDSHTGTWFPSATTYLEAYPKGPGMIKFLKDNGPDAERIMEEAGDRGSRVHQMTELYDLGHVVSIYDGLDGRPYAEMEWAMFERYVSFSELHVKEIQLIEERMVDPDLKVGGTLDRLLVLNDGRRMLVDIKTGNGIYTSHWLQQSVYLEMLRRRGYGDDIGVGILWLNAKTRGEGRGGAVQGNGWQLITPPESMEHYFLLFQMVQNLWWQEHRNAAPRHRTYKSTHQRLTGRAAMHGEVNQGAAKQTTQTT